MAPRRVFSAALRLWLATALVAGLPQPASAQSLLRDAGMEHGLDLIAQPILVAAGLPTRRTRILVVNDMSLNAFVVDSRTVFIHAGLLLRMQSAAQLQAVIAHEVAHIANGHFARRSLNAASSRTTSGVGILLGIALGAATGNPALGAGVIAGSAGTSRSIFLGHTRAEESAADQSGMRYLVSAGVDPSSLRDVLELFEGQELLNISRQDAYAQSHPLTSERMRAVDTYIAALPKPDVDQSTAEYWFQRSQGLLSAYLNGPGYTMVRFPPSRTDDAAVMSRAMAYARTPDLANARREMAVLLDRLPDDAYVQELAGWIELESGNAATAIPYYSRAAELAPQEPLILAGLGRALLAGDTTDGNRQALDVLETARDRDPFDGRLLRDLSIAYARAGNDGMASLATAERYSLAGRLDDAAIHAHRASGLLPVGSPGWSRAQDIIRAADAASKRR